MVAGVLCILAVLRATGVPTSTPKHHFTLARPLLAGDATTPPYISKLARFACVCRYSSNSSGARGAADDLDDDDDDAQRPLRAGLQKGPSRRSGTSFALLTRAGGSAGGSGETKIEEEEPIVEGKEE